MKKYNLASGSLYVLFIGMVVVPPFVVWMFPTNVDSNWLGFWGGVAGAVFSSLISIIIVRSQSKMDDKKISEEKHEALLPYFSLNVTNDGNTEAPYYFNLHYVSGENTRPLLDVIGIVNTVGIDAEDDFVQTDVFYQGVIFPKQSFDFREGHATFIRNYTDHILDGKRVASEFGLIARTVDETQIYLFEEETQYVQVERRNGKLDMYVTDDNDVKDILERADILSKIEYIDNIAKRFKSVFVEQ